MAKRYEKYKDSGIAWIGEMPEHWDVFPIKHLCRYEKYSVKTGPFGTQLKGDDLQESGDVIVYNQKNVIYQRFDEVRFYVSNQKANELKSFYTQPNDFLITSRGTIGRAAILPNTADMGILHPCLIALRLNRSKVLDKWLLYFINDTDCFRTGIQLASNATTIEVIYTETLKKSLVAIPSIPEQEQIAKYLDWKCGEVDRIVEVRERQIKLLGELRTSVISRAVTRGLNPNAALKDSGIDWIGQIPEHWEVRRIKSFCIVKRGASPRPIDDEKYFDDNGEFAWVRIADASASKKYLLSTTQKLSSLGASLSVKRFPDDIFLSIAGTVGKAIITKIKCCIHDGFVWFKNLNYNSELLYYIFESGQPYLGLGKMGTQLNLNTDTVGNIPIPYMSNDEQQQIADYLDKKTAEIDSTINKFKVQIDKLKEYRQALITEVVTGKIDVRGIEIPTPKSN